MKEKATTQSNQIHVEIWMFTNGEMFTKIELYEIDRTYKSI